MKKDWWKLAIVVLLVVALITTIVRIVGKKSTENSIDISYIQMMEQKDISSVKEKISNNKKEEKRELLLNGQLSIWEQFEDFAILGDSRAVGFYYMGFLDQERVLAHGGATIRDIKETYWDQLAALNPKYIFLCFGLNDVSIGYWNTPEEYVTEYREILEELHSTYPDARICVSSTLIARDPAFEKSQKWREIPEFNVAIKAMCQDVGCGYADNSEICDTYAEYWDPDGIHVGKDFYPFWAANLIAEVEDDE